MQIHTLRDALKEIPEETKGNVEKKQARTYEELLAEQAEQEEVRSSFSVEEGLRSGNMLLPLRDPVCSRAEATRTTSAIGQKPKTLLRFTVAHLYASTTWLSKLSNSIG